MDKAKIAAEAAAMRAMIEKEKPSRDLWDIKLIPGGLIDLEFIAQYLQLVNAADCQDILDSSTAGVFERAWRLGILPTLEAETLRPAVRLYNDLTQILRLCLTRPFEPQAAGNELLRLLARAADLPDFATLDAHLVDVQERVRTSFVRILGEAP